MAAFDFHQRRTRRWWYGGAALLAVALFAVFSVASASGKLSSVKVGATLSGSPYNGADGALDNVAGIQTATDDPSGSADNAFGQGTKEDDPNVTIVDGSIPPNKNDLIHFYEGSTQTNSGVFLYLGWSRAVNIGNANLDFEINKHATTGFDGSTTGPLTLNRTAGDLLVTYDFGGSGTPTLGLNRWLVSATNPVVSGFATNTCLAANSFPCWGDHLTLTSSVSEGSVSSDGLFGEAVVNLTATGVLGSGVCDFGQATTFLKSRSSSSFTAELKDFIAPISTPLSPCGTITIIKHTLNAAGTRSGVDQSFGYTTTGTGLSSFSLNDSAGTDNTTNKKTFTGLGPGSYSVTETLPVTGFALNDLTCSASGTGTSVTPNGSSSSASTASITMGVGGNVTCTYTNQQQSGAIKVTKTSIKSASTVLSGATFTVKDSGGNVVTGGNLTTGADGTACVAGLPFGSYTVTETGAPPGYTIDNSTPVSVSVSAVGTCSTGTQVSTSFTDTPKTDLTVEAKSQVAGGTQSTISCVDSGQNPVGTGGTKAEDSKLSATDLAPGTYTCTVVIDP